MLSMARWIADKQSEADVVFLHVARRQSELIFARELKQLGSTPAPGCASLLSQEAEGSSWRGARGRLTAAISARCARSG